MRDSNPGSASVLAASTLAAPGGSGTTAVRQLAGGRLPGGRTQRGTVAVTRSDCARGAVLTVDLDAVAANTRLFAARTRAGVMAVVKADGFGHGSAEAARTALANGATWLGVTSIAEGLALREAGLTAPVLSWLNPVDADFGPALAAAVDVAVPSLRHFRAVMDAARAGGHRARVHLHLDVGMARDGAEPAEWPGLCRAARAGEQRGVLQVVGLMAHLGCAGIPADTCNKAGRARFAWGLEAARAAGLRPGMRHLAATAAALTDPRTHHTLCRIGAGLAGIDPSGTTRLHPALTLTAPVVAVRRVRAGSRAGYGQRAGAKADHRRRSADRHRSAGCAVKARVAVIGGGRNCEHEVSLASAAAAAAALAETGYDVVGLTIGTDGTWHDGGAPLPGLAAAVRILSGCDAVVPVVHGPHGEDGTLAALCDLAGITCVGSGLRAGALAMDKHVTKLIAADRGIATAPAVLLTAGTAAGYRWTRPVVVKPVAAGSSRGVTLAGEPAQLPGALAAAFALDDQVLAEDVITGREIDLAVLGPPRRDPPGRTGPGDRGRGDLRLPGQVRRPGRPAGSRGPQRR
jgi:alanine racemase